MFGDLAHAVVVTYLVLWACVGAGILLNVLAVVLIGPGRMCASPEPGE